MPGKISTVKRSKKVDRPKAFRQSVPRRLTRMRPPTSSSPPAPGTLLPESNSSMVSSARTSVGSHVLMFSGYYCPSSPLIVSAWRRHDRASSPSHFASLPVVGGKLKRASKQAGMTSAHARIRLRRWKTSRIVNAPEVFGGLAVDVSRCPEDGHFSRRGASITITQLARWQNRVLHLHDVQWRDRSQP